MTRKLFGTDGIRGKANVYPMTGEVAMALGRAVTHYFQNTRHQKRPTIIIGKDTRLSCYTLEQAFAAGVCSQGGRAVLTGPLPTPGVAFVTISMRAQAGVMISASHNSFADNGIKIFDSTGHKLPDEVELELENIVLNQDLLPVQLDGELGNAKRLDEVIGRYIVHVKSALPDDFNLDGMRIVIDCAHGAGYRIAPMIFSELGADVIPLGVHPNGQNINLGCGSTFPSLCAEKVIKYRADLGICLDGDADRLVVIDNEGKVVDGDQIIGVLAKFLLAKKELKAGDEVVGTIMSNLGLSEYLKGLGLNFSRTKVGDRYIVERMQAGCAFFGGEPSGHLIFKNHSTTGDGILAAMRVIEALHYFKLPLRKLADEVELYPQQLKNVTVKEKKAFDQSPGIMQAKAEAEKALGEQGRVLLRYSGTEPLARVMVEGKNSKDVELYCQKIAQAVSDELGESHANR